MAAIFVDAHGAMQTVNHYRKFTVHQSLETVDVVSKLPLNFNKGDLHEFSFPPPFNSYVLPRDALIVRRDGRPIKIKDVLELVKKNQVTPFNWIDVLNESLSKGHIQSEELEENEEALSSDAETDVSWSSDTMEEGIDEGEVSDDFRETDAIES